MNEFMVLRPRPAQTPAPATAGRGRDSHHERQFSLDTVQVEVALQFGQKLFVIPTLVT